MKKTMVAYFSASGVTARVAKELAKVVNADVHEIQPKQPYSHADLDWENTKSRSSIEMKDVSFRPAIANQVDDMNSYDVIYLGFPIWWYIAPTIINTFLESYDFSGKTIILFATSGSSGFGNTKKHLLGSVSSTATMKEGRLLNGHPNESELKVWVDSLTI